MARASAAPLGEVYSDPAIGQRGSLSVTDILLDRACQRGRAGDAALRYHQGSPEHTARSDVRIICGTFQCFRLVSTNA
jgi:hypothetical protein